MKFTDVQLSRILSAHAGAQLEMGGGDWALGDYRCCLVQASDLNPFPSTIHTASQKWFDREYNWYWSPDQLLRELELRGWA